VEEVDFGSDYKGPLTAELGY